MTKHTITPTRRDFLHKSLLAGSLVGLAPRSLLAASANSQVNLGIIGCGWRGGQLLEIFSELAGVRIAGLCDPDRQRLGETAAKYSGARQWTDLRDMLDDKDIEAVAISACNHWHGLATIWALEAGKHVYVEKPLTNTLWEGQQVVDAVRRSGRVCQIGTQQRSDRMQEQIKQFLHEDKALGKISWVRVNRYGVREPIGKRSAPIQIPASVNYDLWLGPAQDQPILRDELHYDWHWDWNTGSGEMGNWGVHVIDDVRNNVFRDQVAFPSKVLALGGRYVWNDAGNTPNVLVAGLQAGDIPVLIGLTNLPAEPGEESSPAHPGPGSGYIVHCQGGRLEGKRGGAIAFAADGQRIKEFKGNGGNNRHQRNFIDAIRSDDPSMLIAPVDQGHYSTTWCNLPNAVIRTAGEVENTSATLLNDQFEPQLPISELQAEMRDLIGRFGDAANAELLDRAVVLEFDAESQHFTGEHAAAANQFLRCPQRKAFAIAKL